MKSRGLNLPTPALELWAGVECTVNRVRADYFDQLERGGHARRADDLDLFASLGVRTMRYPVLWERTAPRGVARADWAWADERLAKLRALGVRPVVGLVHHGSGPAYTSLADPEFPNKLAEYARAVARRYPWVEDYTPINEPLTTARFSGLYGHWYPHGRDDRTFARCLVNQCRAVALAMRAAREVNPGARLVQTEDVGKTFSTRRLAYQAEFENERRWLSFDLLCGRVARDHPMREYLLWAGVAGRELDWFTENPCPPDVVGVNHYLTSERFLDERVSRYPACAAGGNGRHRYADVEAVRVCAEGAAGVRAVLREAWERYRLPLAVTEAHLGCTREEQLRWLKEVWDAARSLRDDEGADVRAVAVWSLLGAHDWHCLLTRDEGRYEPGVFDLRAPRPRPTALARMARDLAAGREHDHPALDSPGWWRRLDRLIYKPVRVRHGGAPEVVMDRGFDAGERRARAVLIAGATGTLGRAFARVCAARGLSYHLLARAEMDVAERGSVERALARYEPWAVVNAAGYVRVDDAEREAERCMRENADGAGVLAQACAARGVALLTFSSDLVFDGAKGKPYVECDATAPLGVYGWSKAEAERRVLASHSKALVVRTSAFFGPWDEHNFLHAALREVAAGRRFVAASDSVVSPTYVPDLVHACLDLLVDGERGVWHLANGGAISWADFARRAAREAGHDERLVAAAPTKRLRLAAMRPPFSALASERAQLLPPLEDALARYLRERLPEPAASNLDTAFERKRAG
ncbi:MAG: sugar nucleotide-binding protein [Acidobacteria bacterium]|nr:sugar nucleotide-binding protein [Acidobacteriota bacterium]